MSILGLISVGSAQGQPSDVPWADPFYPYRLVVELAETNSGPTAIDLDLDLALERLAEVSADVAGPDTFAFENAVLVNPATGSEVGRFHLHRLGDAIPVEGDFQALASGEDSAWVSFGLRSGYQVEDIAYEGETLPALMVDRDAFVNCGFDQRVTLEPGATYLLEYLRFSDSEQGGIYVALRNPEKRLFAQEHHSYYNKLPPRATWTPYRVFYRPSIAEPHIRIGAAFTGRCGIAGIRLQRVDLRLVAELDVPTDRLHLYCVMRAGHRLPSPAAFADEADPQFQPAAVRSLHAEAQPLNPDCAWVEQDGIQAWTVSPDIPLKAEVLPATRPGAAAASTPVSVDLFRGGSATVLVAVDAGTPLATFTRAECTLPLPHTFNEVAGIPLYDGAFGYGKKVETRLDAMVPLNFEHAPPAPNGIHLVAVTLTAGADTAAGRAQGVIRLEVQNQVPRRTSIEIPVSARVLGATVKPMEHFGTLFGGAHFMVRYSGGPFTRDSVTVAEYHGYDGRGLEPPTAVSLSSPDTPDDRFAHARSLARKYYHRMLDHHVIPQSLTLYSAYSYRVDEQGDDRAPILRDWDFALFDEAIDQLVIARDIPWLTVYHSNGYLMDTMRLANGTTYTLRSAEDKPTWKQLPPDAFYQLVGDFFEALAVHLDEKGVLDRTIFVIDESGPDTFGTIRDYVKAIKSRPHARRIKIGHTMYKIAAWTNRGEDGRLLLDDILDVPMPDNDDLFSFFEPEWNARMTTEDKEQWVYYVETDHFNLNNAGLSTMVTPLKLGRFGARGWYCWASFIWDMPYPKTDVMGPKFPSGPVVNPWLNPFYHHGPGLLSFFYPPDPRGPAHTPTDRIIPSYRLALMRDGIQLRALLAVAEAGRDDAGNPLAVDAAALAEAKAQLERLWGPNPVQWYLSLPTLRSFSQGLYRALGSDE